MDRFRRLNLIITQKSLTTLQEATVMVVGIGGVGAMASEALARSAIGKIILVDFDVIQVTNINRQLHATDNTIGLKKVEVMADRIKSINPDCEVVIIDAFYDHTSITLFEQKIDYVIDAIDTISSKLDLIESCHERSIKIISCMGMGNRMDPSLITYSTLAKTDMDPLAKAMRLQARKRNISYRIDVVVSKEKPVMITEDSLSEDTKNGRTPPGSSAFVPNAAGLLCAAFVVNKLISNN